MIININNDHNSNKSNNSSNNDYNTNSNNNNNSNNYSGNNNNDKCEFAPDNQCQSVII